MVLARELTKLHEEFLRGSAAEIYAILSARESVKGEITLVIGRAPVAISDADPLDEVTRLEAQGMLAWTPLRWLRSAWGCRSGRSTGSLRGRATILRANIVISPYWPTANLASFGKTRSAMSCRSMLTKAGCVPTVAARTIFMPSSLASSCASVSRS
jgi:hypothetical protein